MARLTLIRWGIVVNTEGALGSRLTRRYVQESLRLVAQREALERAFARS